MSWSITDADALERVILGLKMKIASRLGAQEGMTVVDVGCGQGGFTAALARMVGDSGRVVAVDVTDEYLMEFKERLGRCGVEDRVTFVQADAINLEGILPSCFADLVVGFRLLEELKNCRDMPKVVGEMIHVTRSGRKTCFIEMSTEARNRAEEAYIRLHRESGDCFFSEEEILEEMNGYGLVDIHVDEVDSDIWFSPDLAKQNLSHAQVWSDSDVVRRLGSLIEVHGMKYPKFLIFSGRRP